jgi:hypothetical protein
MLHGCSVVRSVDINSTATVKSSQVKSIKDHVLGDTPSCVLGPGLMLISADSLFVFISSLPVCPGSVRFPPVGRS